MHQAERNAAVWGRKRGKTNAHRSHRFQKKSEEGTVYTTDTE